MDQQILNEKAELEFLEEKKKELLTFMMNTLV